MKPNELLSVLHTAERLKDTTRHCYTSRGRHESVAEHSWRVTLMAFLMRDEFPELDMDKVIKMCLIHDIVEIDAIRALSDADQIVIACGGGGIPVIPQKHILKGASAVIEKDSIAGKLASDLQADTLVILTGVDKVYRNFGKDNQEPIEKMTVAEAKAMMEAGEFEAGTMLPKIEAAVSYLEKVPGGSVLITSMEHVKDALKGKNGTVITA